MRAFRPNSSAQQTRHSYDREIYLLFRGSLVKWYRNPVDGDMFAERTGWVKGDDGFLVLDANGNGRIDNISEMFGDRFQGGYDELASYDSNGDGKISVGDLIWPSLQVWQDKDRDGITDAGELKSLQQLGIVELSLNRSAISATTPQGARLLGRGDVRFANGAVRSMFEAIFTSSDVETKYAGEAGTAPWQSGNPLNAKGYGSVTDLAVAIANDPELGTLAQNRAASMVTPDLRTLVAQAGDMLGQWGMTLETSKELYAVRAAALAAAANENQQTGAWPERTFILSNDNGAQHAREVA